MPLLGSNQSMKKYVHELAESMHQPSLQPLSGLYLLRGGGVEHWTRGQRPQQGEGAGGGCAPSHAERGAEVSTSILR